AAHAAARTSAPRDGCPARSAYAALVRQLVRMGALPPDLPGKATDRALAELLDASPSTLRNWRRCRTRSPQPRLLERARARLPRHSAEAHELAFLQELTGGARSIARAAESLVSELQRYTLSASGGWHLYEGPLYLSFNPGLSPERRGALMERSGALLEAILDQGLTHREVPALPELIRYSVHGWHHASRFDVRRRSVQERVAHVGASYLGRIELALYLGDVCAMPALFAGTPRSAQPYTRRALALLDEAGPADEDASPIGIGEARVMVRAVEAQILACHGDDRTHARLERFERHDGASPPSVAWIDSVRLGARGYIALRLRGDPVAAAEAFQVAARQVDAWLSRVGIPFGSTSHFALAAYAMALVGDPERGDTLAHRALLRSLEHNVIVDEVAARLVLARLADDRNDTSRARYHRARGATLVEAHHLDAWQTALDHLLHRPPA
ncbi:MAG: hypothetical protein P8Y13_10445, partial [Deinococcales bacterium]